MSPVNFDDQGVDRNSFAPFILINQLDSEWKDVRLSFSDWDWIAKLDANHTINGYYLNGYGVQGLVMACRLNAGLDIEADGIDYNSEGDTCFIHFTSLDQAVRTARLAADMFKDRCKLEALIKIAQEKELDD